MKNKNPFFLAAILALLSLTLLAACQTSPGPEIVIEEAWGRPSPQVAPAGAFYMTIINRGNQADNLVSAFSPSCVAVELHESYDKGEGVMGMRPVEGGAIPVPAQDQVALKMGGLHLMCIDKLDDFQEGARLSVTLSFEVSGEKTVDVEIRQPED